MNKYILTDLTYKKHQDISNLKQKKIINYIRYFLKGSSNPAMRFSDLNLGFLPSFLVSVLELVKPPVGGLELMPLFAA